MRHALLAFTVVWLVGSPALAAEPLAIDDADRAAIRETVEEQLAAFARDDDATAYALAAPGIQVQFETVEKFMAMVRVGYQPVYRPRSVAFQEVISWQGMPTQLVFVVGPDGRSFLAHYPMEHQSDGSWRIAGCVLVELEGQSI